jgi:preprotein translocase subunit SecD
LSGKFPIRSIVLIVIIVVVALLLDLPGDPGIHIGGINRDVFTHLGLDLIGGTQTLLEADLPDTTEIDPESMKTARDVVERRVNGLGVSEAIVQSAGDRRIVVELPGIENPEDAIATIKGTALLEFVDFSSINQTDAINMVGQAVQTDFISSSDSQATGEGPVLHTIMTGADLKSVNVSTDQLNRYQVQFELTPDGATIFKDYTGNHIGDILAIVLDKTVISVPQVQGEIPDGSGVIQGSFTAEEANNLAIQLRYGALPIPLRVIQTRTIGPSLGQDSLQKSLIAGGIGLIIVMLFMAIYYRLPGVVADISIMIYIVITYALFRFIPITLTLAGFAGLMLSTGSALDANILIFERLKEELRAGKTIGTSFELGWRRAWPSIRDSNFATLITCAILFWFGSAFGATIVEGFAVTLFFGVIVSLFTAITATRAILAGVLHLKPITNLTTWFGL